MIDIKIVGFTDEWAAGFASLNYEWIEKYFAIEGHDREILDDPRKFVVDLGGQIFVAVADGRAVGTVAMIPSSDSVMELTKMAVSPAFQGHGIGDKLMARCVEYAQEIRIKTIFLESHTKLAPAISLYQKHGFVEVPGDPHSLYVRADIRMELAIPSSSM